MAEEMERKTAFPILRALLLKGKTEAEVAAVHPRRAEEAAVIPKSAAAVEYSLLAKEDPKGFLVQHVKIQNFMGIKDLNMPVSQLISFQREGKSVGIIALLLGLGYDTLFDPSDSLSLCGWNLDDLISRGENNGRIELTLSLQSSAELMKDYGPQLRILRHFRRGSSLESTPFTISFRKAEAGTWLDKNVSMANLRLMLEKLGLSQMYGRAMVLDKGNLDLMKDDPDLQYRTFNFAVEERKKKLGADLEVIEAKMRRLTCQTTCREFEANFCKTQSEIEYPKYNSEFEAQRQRDVGRIWRINGELAALAKQMIDLKEEMFAVLADTETSARKVLEKMQGKYQEYLRLHDHVGNILVDPGTQKLGIWVHPVTSGSDKARFPLTVEEALDSWSLTPPGMKIMSTMGLYLAFWSVMDTCPILAVDAFSAQGCGFNFSAQGLPLLLELIKDCRGKGQQVIASLKELPQF